jgi:hypothetical protein
MPQIQEYPQFGRRAQTCGIGRASMTAIVVVCFLAALAGCSQNSFSAQTVATPPAPGSGAIETSKPGVVYIDNARLDEIVAAINQHNCPTPQRCPILVVVDPAVAGKRVMGYFAFDSAASDLVSLEKEVGLVQVRRSQRPETHTEVFTLLPLPAKPGAGR